jgi:hypothetical protein
MMRWSEWCCPCLLRVAVPARLFHSGIDYRTSVRMQHLSGHVGSVFRRQENEAGRDLIGLPHAPHRHLRTVLSRFVLVKRGRDKRSPDWAGRDRVDANLLFDEGL